MRILQHLKTEKKNKLEVEELPGKVKKTSHEGGN